MPTVKKSLTLDEIVVETVDRLRIQKRPIRSFSAMTCELVMRGASGYKIPIKQKVSERELESGFEGEEQDITEQIEEVYKKFTNQKKSKKESRVETKALLRFCDVCGADLPGNFGKFCDRCGRKLI